MAGRSDRSECDASCAGKPRWVTLRIDVDVAGSLLATIANGAAALEHAARQHEPPLTPTAWADVRQQNRSVRRLAARLRAALRALGHAHERDGAELVEITLIDGQTERT